MGGRDMRETKPTVSRKRIIKYCVPLSPKVYRKNRYPRDVGQPYFELNVQSILQIMSELTKQYDNLSYYAVRYGSNNDYRYYKDDFDSLSGMMNTYGWSLTELDSTFNKSVYSKSVSNIQTWLQELQ
jgi:hypothetical protein